MTGIMGAYKYSWRKVNCACGRRYWERYRELDEPPRYRKTQELVRAMDKSRHASKYRRVLRELVEFSHDRMQEPCAWQSRSG